MVTKRSKTTALRSTGKTAGKPAEGTARRARKAAAPPSHAELDLRDRLKAGPRRAAGPPLVGDYMSRATMDAMRNEVVPEPTDPRNRRARK